MLNILPRRYDLYDCYQNNIIGPVSDYMNICHLPVLWADFNFKNNNDNPRTFEDISIAVDSRYIMSEIWQDYCGISLKIHKCKDVYEFKKIIIKELENKTPVGIILDSNSVPWSKHFQVRPHCILICGIDENSNEFLCSDGDFHIEGICRISIQGLFNQYHSILLFSQNKTKKRDFKESLEYLVYIINKNNPQKSEDIKKFIHSFEECWDAGNVIDLSTSISKSYFLLDLTLVCNSRYNFMKGIEYFYREFQTKLFFPIVQELNNLFNKWDAFKGLYIKAIISEKKKFIENALNLLYQIEEEEKSLTQKLLLCCEEGIAMLP